jgi:hypothetical protein
MEVPKRTPYGSIFRQDKGLSSHRIILRQDNLGNERKEAKYAKKLTEKGTALPKCGNLKKPPKTAG